MSFAASGVSFPLTPGRLGQSLHAWMAFAQLMLLVIGFQVGKREVWLVSLALMAVLALVSWMTALRRRRAMHGTPTSQIASAAQGQVELRGVGRLLDENPLRSPLTHRLCLWYRYEVHEDSGEDGRGQNAELAQSQTCFVLDDRSGSCLVDPSGAEILTRHCVRWTEGRRRYTEWTLKDGDELYVLGNFVTRHPQDGLNASADMRELLAEWKQDRVGLLKRFDLDHDGQLDAREWELVRRLARGEIDKRHRELRLQPELHLVQGVSARGRYLISNYAPERLARRYLWISVGQLAVFFTALGWLAWWWQRAV